MGNSGALSLSTLNGGNGFKLDGTWITTPDNSGISVRGVGDVNSDGIQDLMIGAYFSNNGRGCSYVVFCRDFEGLLTMSFWHIIKTMRVINRKELDRFKKRHPQSIRPLAGWETVITQSEYRSFNELRRAFPSADYLPSGYTVFNIGGNKYRLITEMDYPFRMVDVKVVWTHAEYSHAKNSERLRRGQL